MKVKTFILFLIVAIYTGIAWVEKTRTVTPITFEVPTNWPTPIYNFSENPISKEGFELGKELFYDGILSIDGNFPCASCHQQFGAFNNYDHVLSHGYNNQLTLRNAPALQNLAWQKSFMWDGSIEKLDNQIFVPLNAHNEMGETTQNVLKKLNKDTGYARKFKQVFQQESIDSVQLGKALSQFLLMLVSSNSKYDKVKKGEQQFTAQEQNGYNLFLKKCNNCHTEPLFSNQQLANNGLLPDNTLNDFGKYNTTKNNMDYMSFKVPSLRNAQVTFPYGHDGRFFRLYPAIKHYHDGIVVYDNLDSSLVNSIHLNPQEIGQLIVFINTLTDSSFLSNPMFAPKDFVISPSLMHTH
jgi:cytochrome c peroxidase